MGSRSVDAREEERRTAGARRAASSGSWSLSLILILGAMGVAGLGLLLVCGGLGAFLYFRSVDGPAAPAGAGVAAGPVAPPVQAPAQAAPLPPIKGASAPGGKTDVLPLETLESLKRASVFIKTQSNTDAGSGSGFVARSLGTTVYIVTNHHVIAPRIPDDDDDDDDFPPGFPRPRFGPAFPRMPPPPRFPRFAGPRLLTVVFASGEAGEQALRAEVIAAEPQNDLAVLKVSGVQNAPNPIDCGAAGKLVETMQIYAFGFPFGEALAENRRNPAITVTKGAVSSLRNDDRGELSAVQIDGDLNPGNSGGPIVDTQGRLVGVAKARVTNSKIGLAVPAAKVQRLMDSLAAWGKLGQ